MEIVSVIISTYREGEIGPVSKMMVKKTKTLLWLKSYFGEYQSCYETIANIYASSDL